MFKSWPVTGLALLALLAGQVHAEPLTLAEAERIAIERDAERSRLLEESAAQRDSALAESALPDPEVRLGAANLPVDSFSLDQEAMTQLVVGVRQVFPPGDTLEYRKERGNWLAHGRVQQAGDRERLLRRTVRQLWLERQAADAALERIGVVRGEIQPLLAAGETRYATGSGQQADYLAAKLRLDRLEDREMQARERRTAVVEMLVRYLGEAAREDYQESRLAVPGERNELQSRLEHHPRVRANDAQIAAGEAGVNAAREQFGPRWALDFSYGDRRGLDPMGRERPDFASAMVSMSIPLFNRDAKRSAVSAAKSHTRAATYARIDALRELESKFDETWMRHADVTRQIMLHEEQLLPSASQAAASMEQAYGNGRVALDRVVETRLDLLALELRRIDLVKRRDQLRAELDYLGGPAR